MTEPATRFDPIWTEWRLPADMRAHADRHGADRAVLHAEFHRLLSTAGEGAASLEIGCGTALDSSLLALKYPGLRAVATDYSEPALAVARAAAAKLGATVECAKADATALPYPNGMYDLVFSQGVVEHFPDPLPMLREQARVTKAGGAVVVDVPQTFNLYTLVKQVRQWQGRWPWGWETQYSVSRLARLGRRAGLVPERFVGYGWWRGRADLLWQVRRWGPAALWDRLERAAGARFLMNLVGVFRKT